MSDKPKDDMDELLSEHDLGNPSNLIDEEFLSSLAANWEAEAIRFASAGRNGDAAKIREMAKQLFRVIHIGMWAEKNKEALVSVLQAFSMYDLGYLAFLSDEEYNKLRDEASAALNTAVWSKE